MYGKEKWYLETWFICLLAAFSVYIIPGIAALVLLGMQVAQNKKLQNQYGDYSSLATQISNRQNKLAELTSKIKDAESEISSIESSTITSHYDFSDYDALSSEDCKNKLALLKNKEKDYIKSNAAVIIKSTATKKIVNNNIKQLLRCFNCECDNVLLNLSVKNVDSSRNKITKSFETLNKIFETDGVTLNSELLSLKLEELNLVYMQEKKKEEEKEIQKAIKEQMLEEQKVLREIEKQKKQIEKDESQFRGEMSRLMKYMQNTDNDIEKQLYIDKIKELEDKLKELETEKADVTLREQNAKAGFVYIISNIGSFGEDIYKIGMTRRLEPMDRINELSSASVPFAFDVHAMIFSNDAPSLESQLHQHFRANSVNKVNYRKEFFKVSIDEIESFVKENHNELVEFTKVPLAKEYRESIAI